MFVYEWALKKKTIIIATQPKINIFTMGQTFMVFAYCNSQLTWIVKTVDSLQPKGSFQQFFSVNPKQLKRGTSLKYQVPPITRNCECFFTHYDLCDLSHVTKLYFTYKKSFMRLPAKVKNFPPT